METFLIVDLDFRLQIADFRFGYGSVTQIRRSGSIILLE